MNPRSTDYNVDALTTAPSRRCKKWQKNLASSPLTKTVKFTILFPAIQKTPLHHFVLWWHVPSIIHSSQSPLVSACSMSSSVAFSFVFQSLQNLTLFSTHHHPSSEHAHTIALHSLSPVYSVFSKTSTSIGCWLVFLSSIQNHLLLLLLFTHSVSKSPSYS